MSHDHYYRDVSTLEKIDVYRVLDLFGVTCPVAQHVVKKALAAGQRGHKSTRRDWQDIADSAKRRLQMIDEDAGWVDATIKDAAITTYAGQGGVMIRCPDCSVEHCACLAG